MMLVLYCHPLAAYCWKVLIPLYEAGTAFTAHHIDPSQPQDAALLASLSPQRLMPVLRDGDRLVWESSVVIEYLDLHHPGAQRMIPADPEAALAVRMWDRFFDNGIGNPMQAIVLNQIRPEAQRDPLIVAEQTARLDRAYAAAEAHLTGRDWVAEAFSLADCAAAPVLFYAGIIHPFDGHPALSAYFARLMARPSVRRVIDEARPVMRLFPFHDRIPARFLT